MHLRNLVMLGLFCLIPAGECVAQVRGDDYHGHGYVYVAPGGLTAGGSTLAAIGLGAGGEAMLYKGLAAGADVGWQGPTQSFRNGFGLASFNGAYHFVSSQHERRLVPFVTAGYTRSFGNQSGANLANYGAGVQYWFKENWAFRVEGRDHINTTGPVAHAWQIRLAIVFR